MSASARPPSAVLDVGLIPSLRLSDLERIATASPTRMAAELGLIARRAGNEKVLARLSATGDAAARVELLIREYQGGMVDVDDHVDALLAVAEADSIPVSVSARALLLALRAGCGPAPHPAAAQAGCSGILGAASRSHWRATCLRVSGKLVAAGCVQFAPLAAGLLAADTSVRDPESRRARANAFAILVARHAPGHVSNQALRAVFDAIDAGRFDELRALIPGRSDSLDELARVTRIEEASPLREAVLEFIPV